MDSLKFYERDPLLQEIRKRYRFATFQEAGLNERFFLGPCRVVPTITSSILTCFSDIDCRRGLGGSTSRLSAGSLLQNPCEASLGIECTHVRVVRDFLDKTMLHRITRSHPKARIHPQMPNPLPRPHQTLNP